MDDKIEALEAIERDARALLDELDVSSFGNHAMTAIISLKGKLKAIDKIRKQSEYNNAVREFMYAAMDNHGVLDDDGDDELRESIFDDILHDMDNNGYMIVKFVK